VRRRHTLAITLGPTQCGVWIAGEVLLDILRRSTDEMVAAFDLSAAWWWDWEQDFKGCDTPDAAVLRAPHEMRAV
jgi:hypothetical protein